MNEGLLFILLAKYITWLVTTIILLVIFHWLMGKKVVEELQHNFIKKWVLLILVFAVALIPAWLIQKKLMNNNYVNASFERPAILFDETNKPVKIITEPTLSVYPYFYYSTDYQTVEFNLWLRGKTEQTLKRKAAVVSIFYKMFEPDGFNDQIISYLKNRGLQPKRRGDDLNKSVELEFREQNIWSEGDYSMHITNLGMKMGANVLAVKYFLDPPIPWGPGAQ